MPRQRTLNLQCVDVNWPWPLRGVPHGFEPRVPVPSQNASSATAAFDVGLDQRDIFLGILRCVICGNRRTLQRCHVHPKKEDQRTRRPSRSLLGPRRADPISPPDYQGLGNGSGTDPMRYQDCIVGNQIVDENGRFRQLTETPPESEATPSPPKSTFFRAGTSASTEEAATESEGSPNR
ncbi:hypothetical protein BT96DRAFT_993876 [Gymnopus androsaceus JB14]|uniref:Uncharacterized protein n=1 Tax=Gymnopus androsaceus JB14 TaxID=1447944 RepID=A0A6A4HR88_9AGAR|nr:hypothetical protein BT96DRAFT_993876 [Gymnopus androsaceus JB14]